MIQSKPDRLEWGEVILSNEEETQDILDLAEEVANPTPGKVGRKPVTRRRDSMLKDIQNGLKDRVDRGWLLWEYLQVYYKGDVKPQDKKNILDSIARLSGYGAKQDETPESEKQAIADLMRDLKGKDEV